MARCSSIVPEALGDHAEDAVFKAFNEVAPTVNMQGIGQREFGFRGTGILAALYWDQESRYACLHLELVHTEQAIGSEDYTEAERVLHEGRSLN